MARCASEEWCEKNLAGASGQGAFGIVLRSQTRSFVKALIGFTAFGAEGSEVMAVVQTAMLGGLPYTALRDAIFTHPTAAEGLVARFSNVQEAQG